MSVEAHIEQHLNQSVISKHTINTGLFSAYKVVLNNTQVFVKYQSRPSQQLIQEATELSLLGKYVCTPKVFANCEHCLILEWIEAKHNPNMQIQTGQALAKLHKTSAKYFGFHTNNSIGITKQLNAVGKNSGDWADFYWEYRLLYQIELAYQNTRINKNEYQQLLSIKNQLSKLLNNDIKPSLLHGDLWSGNLLNGVNYPYFIDPACYYGHREMDFALTFMFGGFSSEFYQAYNIAYPLENGFEQRKPLYMLYHYLNHLNIFGGDYHTGVINCLNKLLKI